MLEAGLSNLRHLFGKTTPFYINELFGTPGEQVLTHKHVSDLILLGATLYLASHST